MGVNMDKKKISQDLDSALNADIPHLYANAFTNAIGNGDVIIVLRQGGKQVATLNLSYTVAKTLASKLGELINTLENRLHAPIFTVDQIHKVLSEEASQSKKLN